MNVNNPPDYSRQYTDKRKKNLSKISTFKIIKSFKKNSGNVLEIACGPGYLLDFLGGGTGIDINPQLIKEAQENYPASRFIVANCYNIPIENEKFDTIIMSMIIEHLSYPEKALLEAKRLLNKDGNLVIVTPRRNDVFYRLFVPKDPTHVKEYTVSELSDIVSSFFKIKQIKFGSVSTKIPAWLTFLIKPDIIFNCMNI